MSDAMPLLVLWFLAGLLCIALVYYLFSVYAAWRFFRPRPTPGTALPPVTILKPLKGAPPDLYDSLASFCRLDYPTFQIMCGVRDPDDPAVAVVKKVQHDFPQCDMTLVVASAVIGTNYKVSSLHHLTPQMKYDYLVITDSDVCVEPDYLQAIIPPLTQPETGLVTCVYRGGSRRPLPALLESLMINTTFTTQVVIGSQVEQPAYAFGATMALKRACLDAIGGFARLSDYLADDYYLGYLISQAGYRLRVLPTVVETRPDAGSLRGLFSHQLRWARTQRNCRPGRLYQYGCDVWHGLGLCEPALFLVVGRADAARPQRHSSSPPDRRADEHCLFTIDVATLRHPADPPHGPALFYCLVCQPAGQHRSLAGVYLPAPERRPDGSRRSIPRAYTQRREITVIHEPNMLLSGHRPHRRAGERRKLDISAIPRCPAFDLGAGQEGRVAVQLGDAGLESWQQTQQVGFIQRSALMQAKQMIRVGNKSIMQLFFCRPGEGCKDKGLPAFSQGMARIERQAGRQVFSGQAYGRNRVFLCERQESVHDDRMHMDVEMSVNMGQG